MDFIKKTGRAAAAQRMAEKKKGAGRNGAGASAGASWANLRAAGASNVTNIVGMQSELSQLMAELQPDAANNTRQGRTPQTPRRIRSAPKG